MPECCCRRGASALAGHRRRRAVADWQLEATGGLGREGKLYTSWPAAWSGVIEQVLRL